MTLTRRDLLTATAAAPLALVPDSQPARDVPLSEAVAEGRKMLARVPDALEIARWEQRYRVSYARDHAPPPYLSRLSRPIDDVREDHYDATTMQGAIDTLARLEAEVPPDPTEDHTLIAFARGHGFEARRGGKPATDCAYPDGSDCFFAWHAGYAQAQPVEVLAVDDPKRHRGYKPPTGYRCPQCGRPENHQHQRNCAYVDVRRPHGNIVRKPTRRA